jgi:hypothetical protein
MPKKIKRGAVGINTKTGELLYDYPEKISKYELLLKNKQRECPRCKNLKTMVVQDTEPYLEGYFCALCEIEFNMEPQKLCIRCENWFSDGGFEGFCKEEDCYKSKGDTCRLHTPLTESRDYGDGVIHHNG